ncbi:MAG: hypothetical protein DMG53_11560 [Acidobacteria bacterium]|nr:MAG: hypothetical protein DMG53_11560 [Acidobacteriota bacterium]
MQQKSASDWAIPCLDGVVREIPKKISMPSAPSISESSIVQKGPAFALHLQEAVWPPTFSPMDGKVRRAVARRAGRDFGELPFPP